jgi:hypothetical protein
MTTKRWPRVLIYLLAVPCWVSVALVVGSMVGHITIRHSDLILAFELTTTGAVCAGIVCAAAWLYDRLRQPDDPRLTVQPLDQDENGTVYIPSRYDRYGHGG